MHLAYLHEWKGFYAARYPMHQQDSPTRRSILPHSEGGIFISWHTSQGALVILSGRFEGRFLRHHCKSGAPFHSNTLECLHFRSTCMHTCTIGQQCAHSRRV